MMVMSSDTAFMKILNIAETRHGLLVNRAEVTFLAAWENEYSVEVQSSLPTWSTDNAMFIVMARESRNVCVTSSYIQYGGSMRRASPLTIICESC